MLAVGLTSTSLGISPAGTAAFTSGVTAGATSATGEGTVTGCGAGWAWLQAATIAAPSTVIRKACMVSPLQRGFAGSSLHQSGQQVCNRPRHVGTPVRVLQRIARPEKPAAKWRWTMQPQILLPYDFGGASQK